MNTMTLDDLQNDDDDQIHTLDMPNDVFAQARRRFIQFLDSLQT